MSGPICPIWNLNNVSLGETSDGSSARLSQVTLTINAGSTAIIGYSGSGKTSLLNLLTEFDRPTAGSIEFAAPRAFAAAPAIAPPTASTGHALPLFWVPQDGGLWPHLSAIDHLQTVAPQSKHCEQLLAAFELEHRSSAKPGQLSQGEKARLSVARCLAANPAVMVMDEPLAHVDPGHIERYWQIIRDHCERNATSIVFATHSPEWVLSEAETVVCLQAGRVDYTGPVDRLYYEATTPGLASFLGATNWFTPDDAHRWLPGFQLDSACVRPECLRVIASENGPFVVEDSRFLGSLAEVVVRDPNSDLSRKFRHRPSRDELSPGQRVNVEIVARDASLMDERFERPVTNGRG